MSNVLIVDGQAEDRHFISSLLGCFGHITTEAEDGIVALGLIATNLPNLIIVEILMDVMDGYEFFEQLRANVATASTPVIFCVPACYAAQARAAVATFDFCTLLTKPQDPERILAAVHAALGSTPPSDVMQKLARFAQHPVVSPTDPIDPQAEVFLVDDDPAMRHLMSTLLEGAGLKLQTYATGEEFLDRYDQRPGCLLLDLDLPGMSGIDLLQALRDKNVQIPKIMLTGGGCISSVQKAMRLDSLDFLEKSVSPRTLIARVYFALQLDSIARRNRTVQNGVVQRMAALTDRERELLNLIADGKPSKQIASELRISLKTVANHRSHLLSKTGAANVADLVRMSVVAGEPYRRSARLDLAETGALEVR